MMFLDFYFGHVQDDENLHIMCMLKGLFLLMQLILSFLFRFLKILEIIIQEPGSAFKRFLPSIIDICMDHIYPVIAQVSSVFFVRADCATGRSSTL